MNEIIYEGSVMFGQHKKATVLFTFFKNVRGLSEEEENSLGKTLVPQIELVHK